MNVKNVQLMLRPAACCPTLLCTHQMARRLIVSMHKDCMLVNLTLIFKGQAELLIVKVQVESAFGAIQPKLFLWASANACAIPIITAVASRCLRIDVHNASLQWDFVASKVDMGFNKVCCQLD